MSKSYLLAGVGGQGTVLASRIIAQCAMDSGEAAKTAETIGMAQRGGCVVSHVRVGSDAFSPLIPRGTADLLIGFEPAEAVRCIGYLKPGGACVVSTRAIKPTTDSLSGICYEASAMLDYLRVEIPRLVVVDADLISAQLGSVKMLNLALLGAASGAGFLPYGPERIERVIAAKIPPRHKEQNLLALRLGAACAAT